MARMLLLNFDEASGERLAGFLRTQRHEVRIAPRAASGAALLRQSLREIDLVIVDGSQQEQYVRDLVEHIADYRARNGPRPAMLCICRSYRGPRFELDLEKKGARVIYV